jgi:hypothetical protein
MEHVQKEKNETRSWSILRQGESGGLDLLVIMSVFIDVSVGKQIPQSKSDFQVPIRLGSEYH